MSDTKAGLSRNVGRFFGHIWKGITSLPDEQAGERVETKRETESRTVQTDEGTVTLRRTVIEEIETTKQSGTRDEM